MRMKSARNPFDIARQLMVTVGRAVAKASAPKPVTVAWDPAWARFAGLYRGRNGDSQVILLNQRLVRRVCTDCRQPVEASEEQLSAIGFSEAQIARGIAMYDSRGCDTCSDGFRGRVGVFQLMLVNDEIAELTTQRPSRDVLKNAAFAAGMRTLREDGLDKVARGLTTLAELERALP